MTSVNCDSRNSSLLMRRIFDTGAAVAQPEPLSLFADKKGYQGVMEGHTLWLSDVVNGLCLLRALTWKRSIKTSC